MIDVTTALAFSLFENKGVYALLLGSGLSRAAEIPTGWEITLDLIRRMATMESVTSETDWAAWYRQRAGAEPNYSTVLDTLSSSPDERRSILHSYIEPTQEDIEEGKKIPTQAHHDIAWLVREGFIRVILTTNFDRLMENALREAGVEPTVIRSDDDLRGAVPLIHSRCFIVKLHGDYLDTRIKNTDEELSSYSPVLDALLDRILDDHGLIVCGWSGDWDHALRSAITRTPNRRFPTYWAARGAVSTRANDLIQKRAARTIAIASADNFFKDLREKVSAQTDNQKPDPRSTTLAVARAKRYLNRPEFRIQLSDLLAEESRELARKIGDRTIFPLNGSGSPDDYRSRVRRYETLAETLVRVVGAAGRWGDDAVFALAAEVAAAFASEKIEGGLNWWLDLRFYPAVLLCYAYGLGALKAGRYDLLFRWLSQPVQRDQRESRPFAVRLAHWEGETHDRWKMLDGAERLKTPLSDHLHTITAEWTADYTLADGAHTQLFEAFEILVALTYLTFKATKEEFTQEHAPGNDHQGFIWAPIGRIGWGGGARDMVFADLARTEIRRAILDAGFSSGDEEHLDLALESIRRLMGRMQW